MSKLLYQNKVFIHFKTQGAYTNGFVVSSIPCFIVFLYFKLLTHNERGDQIVTIGTKLILSLTQTSVEFYDDIRFIGHDIGASRFYDKWISASERGLEILWVGRDNHML